MNRRPIPFLRRCRYFAEAALAYFIYGMLRLLPPETSSGFGGFVLRKLGPRMGVSRIALKNLDLAFPDKTAADKRRIIEGMWDNLGRVIGEYPHLRRIGGNIEIIGAEHIRAAKESGKAAIFFGGHLANWEVNAPAARLQGIGLHFVYRKPNNPYVDRLLRHARDSGAAGHVEKGAEGAHAIVKLLRGGHAVGMLVDQKLGEGMAVPFFSHDAMTVTAPAHFALKFGVPLYPTRVERMGGMKFRVTVHPPLHTASTGNMESDVLRILTAMNGMIEEWVRARPEQWLWIHKRWPDSK